MRVCLIYGGKSVEHEISIISANSILNNIDKKKYTIIGIYIEKKGSFRESKIITKKSKLEFKPTKNRIVFPLGKSKDLSIIKNNKIIILLLIIIVFLSLNLRAQLLINNYKTNNYKLVIIIICFLSLNLRPYNYGSNYK